MSGSCAPRGNYNSVGSGRVGGGVMTTSSGSSSLNRGVPLTSRELGAILANPLDVLESCPALLNTFTGESWPNGTTGRAA
jgi:hypothetical protein